MAFDVFVAVATLSGLIAASVWYQIRNAQQAQYEQQQAQFWTKVLSDRTRAPH